MKCEAWDISNFIFTSGICCHWQQKVHVGSALGSPLYTRGACALERFGTPVLHKTKQTGKKNPSQGR